MWVEGSNAVALRSIERSLQAGKIQPGAPRETAHPTASLLRASALIDRQLWDAALGTAANRIERVGRRRLAGLGLKLFARLQSVAVLGAFRSPVKLP